jgi:cell division septal protein FtsQ
MSNQRKTVRVKPAAQREHGAPRIPQWVVGLPVLVVLAVLLGVGLASGWLPSLVVPRKIVVSGNAIIPARELLTAAGQPQTADAYHWWRALARLDGEQVRWLAEAKPRLAWGRTLAVQVNEQRPLLYVKASDNNYWLCEDKTLVLAAPGVDMHPVFTEIMKLPQVEVGCPGGELAPADADGLIAAAACLQQTLPGVMRTIKLDPQGVLWCYNQDGFAIKLGAPEHLAEKVGALPKALRICADERRKLQYLDASDPRIFYQRWQEPPEA